MKVLKASCIKVDTADIGNIHAFLDKEQRHALDAFLWGSVGDDRPDVAFSLAHNDHALLLKFFVREKEMRAVVRQTNGPVWEDSCVEFFISFDKSGYYNFEFNSIGTVLGAFGQGRTRRTFLSEKVLSEIGRTVKCVQREAAFHWELLVIIPANLFIEHRLSSFSGQAGTGNFYKCGDGLPHPHYVAWNRVESETPDFHLPQFFGEFSFL